MDEVLLKIWTTPGGPGAFGSAKKLWRAANSEGYHYKLPQVQKWLDGQKGYLMNKVTPEHPIKPGIASRHFIPFVGMVACDIMYLTGFAKKSTNKYMLICVECLTGFTAVAPINVLSSINVFNAFKNLINLFQTPVYTILSDNGSEFLKDFHRGVEELGYNHKYTSVYAMHKTVQAERMIRVIRQRVSMLLHTYTHLSLNDAIYSVVNSYNHEKRAVLGNITPSDVNKGNYIGVQEIFARAKIDRDLSNLPKSYYPAKFKLNDKVFIRENLAADPFRKIGQPRYNPEVCVITSVIPTEPLHSYSLKSLHTGLKLVGTFPENRLILASTENV